MLNWYRCTVTLVYPAYSCGDGLGATKNLTEQQNVFIIGGDGANIATRPYLVSVEINAQFGCAGAIVKKGWILTVASCVYGVPLPDLLVRAGSGSPISGGETRNVDEVIIHPNYTMYENDFDLAILHLGKPFSLDCQTHRIIIAREPTKEGEKVYLTGWGQDERGVVGGRLKKLQMTVLNHAWCVDKYYPDIVSQRMLCAWNVNHERNAPCWGDFGDPLHNAWNHLVGFYSWGDNDCTSKPAMHTYLYPLRTWIYHNIKNL